MIKCKKTCMYIAFIIILMLIGFTSLMFVIAVDELVNVENSIIMDWFPDDSEIAGWLIFWVIIAGISTVFDIILLILEIRLIKKIKRLPSTKSLKRK